jgi:hypothetical protein
VANSCTASADVANVFTATLQPVCCSNGPTQLIVGSVEPFSA